MSEAIISRRGISKSNNPEGQMFTYIIDKNTVWEVPNGIINNTVYVRIFGGGGGGAEYRGTLVNGYYTNQVYIGGGGGEMNNGEVKLFPGYNVNITIGKGGTGKITDAYDGSGGGTGGTSSFGVYFSANGGRSPDGGSGGGVTTHYSALKFGGNASQFGGGSLWFGLASPSMYVGTKGGHGGIYGGGGAGLWYGGDGGVYGGGGYGRESYGVSGMYGGNGGSITYEPKDGTNTIGLSNIPSNVQGPGLSGKNAVLNSNNPNQLNNLSLPNLTGGGGGYGGNGGIGEGGGGGYGGNGGGSPSAPNIYFGSWIGGGGGYGKGADGGWLQGGGGGYFASGGTGEGGGGGSYGRGSGFGLYYNNIQNAYMVDYLNIYKAGYGGGGMGSSRMEYINGGDGVCIIQFYQYV